MTDRTEKFDKALSAASNVTAERGAVYGHPYDDFDRAARLKDVTAELDDARIGHVLDMICTKIARLIHSPDHLDSWIDIAGYARTAVMVLDERDRRRPVEGAIHGVGGINHDPLPFWNGPVGVFYCHSCGRLGYSHEPWCRHHTFTEEGPKPD